MSLLGRKAEGFHAPVCSAFTRKMVNNQLCYEVDLNRFRDQVDWKESLKSGLSLVIDTNDEYDVRKLMTEDGNIKTTEEDMLDSYFNKNLQEKFSILLKTISKFISSSLLNLICCSYSDPVPITLTRKGSYMLTDIKKISVSSDFLSLPRHNTKCQSDQLRGDCITRKYQEATLELCKCAPISLRHSYPQHVL